MRKAIGVSILTNANCRKYLTRCVESLLANCYYRPLRLAIFDNGSTDDTPEWCSNLSAYGVDVKVDRSEKDLGCAAGHNRVAAMVRDCEYVLHLESDFLHLPEDMTGEDKFWLHRAVEFMEHNTCDYLYLRRMIEAKDIFMHAWSQWMTQVTCDKPLVPYLRCDRFWWSNNPHLRRNDAIYAAGSLPLDESKDGKKGESGWSQPELQAPRPGNAWLHRWGLFVHEIVSPRQLASKRGCGKFPCIAGVTCKYGFFDDGKSLWCQCCYPEQGFEDMPKHVGRFKEMV